MSEYYRRSRYVDEPYEDDRRMRGREPEWERQQYRGPYGSQYGSWTEEDDFAYGYGSRQRTQPRRRYEGDPRSGRDDWYDRRRQAFDEPYGPAHSPAHMRGAGVPLYPQGGYERWEDSSLEDRGYGPAGAPAHTGSHAGRGPKGYQRSPERILDEVAERITRNPDVDASDMEVTVEGDVVVLRGRVYDRRQKRIAEDVAESVGGVRDVRNELDVERGIIETLTDAVTGRSDEEEQTRVSNASPRRNRTGV